MSDETTAPEIELRRRLAAPAGDWVAEAGGGDGDHPDVDALIAYHGGGLPEDEQRRIQDHLVACRECLGHLLELVEFAGPGAGAEGAAGAAEFETAAAWRALRPRLPAAPAARWPRRAVALAAALALAALGLGLYALDQRRAATALGERLAELSRPQPGAAIVDLFPASAVRGEGEPVPVVELPAGAGYATLVINLPEGERYGGYEVEILDPAGRPLWSGGGFEASAFGTLRLGVPGGLLPPGEHSLRLYGHDGEERHWIESYAIRVPGS
jgi:hypothetical protein